MMQDLTFCTSNVVYPAERQVKFIALTMRRKRKLKFVAITRRRKNNWLNKFVIENVRNESNVLLDLPVEIQQHIWLYCEPTQILLLSSVCKELYILTNDDIFWKRMYNIHFSQYNVCEYQLKWKALVKYELKCAKQSQGRKRFRTQLLWAARKGHEQYIQSLFKQLNCEFVDLTIPFLREVLEIAIAYGHVAVVEVILKEAGRKTAQILFRKGALQKAKALGHYEIVDLLKSLLN